MQIFIYSLFFFALTISAAGQKWWHKQGFKLQNPICFASDKIEKAYVPPPAEFLTALKSAEKKSEIIVTYSLFPTEAKTAFEYAVSIWESLIESPVPIYIQANWREKNKNILGSCGPSDFEKDFDGAPHKNVYYPIALAEKIQGIELTGPDRPDMIAEFNKDILWYFGTDGKTPTMMYDFVSVVLHEIGHGLGFTGFFFALDLTGGYSWWDWGDATSFDRLVENSKGEQLIDSSRFENPSVELKSQLVSTSLFANSPVAEATSSVVKPRLYSPATWNDGSSIYHLDNVTYPPGNVNTLMTHSYGRGQATHHPGPVTLGIMADIGWKNMVIKHFPLKDMEIAGPLNFKVNITSDYPLHLSHLFLIFSTDSFENHVDSVQLFRIEPNLFESNLAIGSEIRSLQYYISASDIMNRVFTSPAGAPSDFFTVSFGPDVIPPSISHKPIPFFFDTGEQLKFVAYVQDNVGIDTVFIKYSINGIEQQPFGLLHVSDTVYSGFFPIAGHLLNDNDEITYQIIATDASSSGNTGKFPLNSNLSFKVEKMFDPVTSYSNNFDNGKKDFILHDFDIYTDQGFQNGALHSPHPYPSPNEDNANLNFYAPLKYPVILTANATMSFDEVVLVEPGNKGTKYGDFGFWDYVIIEGSKDKGKTWLPLENGYDSRVHAAWEDNFYSSIADMNSTSVGSSQLYVNRKINMLGNNNFSAGDTILIRFRLYSDPYANGWGWAIDNLQIQLPVTASGTNLSPGNIRVYPNPFSGSFKVVTEPTSFLFLLDIELYSMHGQKLKSIQHKNIAGPVTTEIAVENHFPAVYLLIVKENGKQVLSKKIIQN